MKQTGFLTDRQTDRRTDGRTDRQTERRTDRQKEIKTKQTKQRSITKDQLTDDISRPAQSTYTINFSYQHSFKFVAIEKLIVTRLKFLRPYPVIAPFLFCEPLDVPCLT